MKKWFLLLSKYLGLFRVSEWLYRNRLNILCYHGFAYKDENEFRPSLFMRPSVLETRLAWLARHGYRSVSLSEGTELLKTRALKPKTIVITIDDGFRSTLELAAPLFQKYGLRATVYVTSYYAMKDVPIFRLAMQYFAWKVGDTKIRQEFVRHLPGDHYPSLMSAVEYVEQNMTEPERIRIGTEVAVSVGENYDQLNELGLVSLMNSGEIQSITGYGIHAELHTHRHTLPDNQEGVEKEIYDNRQYLESLIGKNLKHFCYPSGEWQPSQLQYLSDLNIETATTCEPGMNRHDANLLALKRFLDRDDVEQIEFEAELRGYKELLRNVRDVLTSRDNAVDRLNNYSR